MNTIIAPFLTGMAFAFEHVPYAGASLAASLYETAGGINAKAAENSLDSGLRLEATRLFTRAGELYGQTRRGFLCFLSAKDALDSVVKHRKHTASFAEAELCRKIREHHEADGNDAGIEWLIKEEKVLQQVLKFLPAKSERAVRLHTRSVELKELIADKHVESAKDEFKKGDGVGAARHLLAAIGLNEILAIIDKPRELHFTFKASVCCYMLLTMVRDEMSASENISILRKLSVFYTKAAKLFREERRMIASAKLHYQAGLALEHIARMMHEICPAGRDGVKKVLEEARLHYSFSALDLGIAGEHKALPPIHDHMNAVTSYVENPKPIHSQLADPIELFTETDRKVVPLRRSKPRRVVPQIQLAANERH